MVERYVIGDVHGCYQQLENLLTKIAYDAQHDALYFVGDLVNRGPQSALVLELLMSLDRVTVVLGNHDLHLIALYYQVVKRDTDHPLQRLLSHPKIEEMVEWLCQKPLFFIDDREPFALVHAGVPPQWSVAEAGRYAQEVESALRSEQRIDFLKNMYGNEPRGWSENLRWNDRLRYITNALMRMRFCDSTGSLDLQNSSAASMHKADRPWFEWYQQPMTVFFGHWAALNGASTNARCIALDTGCAWGNTLTARRIRDGVHFCVEGWAQ